jgi:hypothetical protein
MKNHSIGMIAWDDIIDIEANWICRSLPQLIVRDIEDKVVGKLQRLRPAT